MTINGAEATAITKPVLTLPFAPKFTKKAATPTRNKGIDHPITCFAAYRLILYQFSSETKDFLNRAP